MVSKVSNSTSPALTTADQRAVKVDKTPPEPTRATGSVDTLKLTALASRLRDLVQSVADVPVVNAQRVDHFKKAINDGSYQVDAMQVAEKLYGFETMMTGGRGKG